MAATFLKDLRPYKTQWRIHVKVLHTWRQYTPRCGETLEMILSDSTGTKIHGSVKKELVVRYANQIVQNEWRFIESFSLSHASGQYRPTSHVYKLNFINGTNVRRSESVSDSQFLSLAKFDLILKNQLNASILQDVLGQIVNIGDLENIEVQGKITKKVDFELRDESDVRMPCTLWGKFADHVIQSCQNAGSERQICLLRFCKIRQYKDTISVSNSFDATQCRVNPPYPEVDTFIQSLPDDGLTIVFRESKARQSIILHNDANYLQYEKKTIAELLASFECGKAKIMCTIYAIDTDWSWYYFSCKKCNKKVTHLLTQNNTNGNVNNQLVLTSNNFWCDCCKTTVTNVMARYKLHVKVMDHTNETKFMLFDSMATEIVMHSASQLLAGSFNEIEDPENLPDALKNLVGKTFQFLVCVEKENVWDGLDTYKVAKVLSRQDNPQEEHALDDDDNAPNPSSIVLCGQDSMALSNCQEEDYSTPVSAKRVLEVTENLSDQSSTTKRLCLDLVDLDSLSDEKSGEKLQLKKLLGVGNFSEDNVNHKKILKDVQIKLEKSNT